MYTYIHIYIDENPCSHNRKFPGLFLSLNLSPSVLLLCVMHRLRWILFGYSRIESTILMGLNETNTRISARSTSQHTHWYENARKRTGTIVLNFGSSTQHNTAQHTCVYKKSTNINIHTEFQSKITIAFRNILKDIRTYQNGLTTNSPGNIKMDPVPKWIEHIYARTMNFHHVEHDTKIYQSTVNSWQM